MRQPIGHQPPEQMLDRENWVVWREEQRDGDKTKVPYQAVDGEYAKTTDASTWTDFETAVEYAGGNDVDGVGFVFDRDDVIVGIDLDDCRDPETGEIDAWAQDIIDRMDTFTEISPSGTGVHLYAIGIKPGDKAKAPVEAEETLFENPEIEMYDAARYFTFTGELFDGSTTTIEQRNSTITEIYDKYLADDEDDQGDEGTDSTGEAEPTAEAVRDIPDDELIERAKKAENGAKFRRLWGGDRSMHDDDHSRADLALCNLLAFWTGGDKSRMDALFRRSGLMRDKWDEMRGSASYGDLTLEEALSNTTEYYQPKQRADPPAPPAPEEHESHPPDDDDAATGGEPDPDDPDPDGGGGGDGGGGDDYWDSRDWGDIYQNYELVQEDPDFTKKVARYACVQYLESLHDFAADEVTDVLYIYDHGKGYYVDRGEPYIGRRLSRNLREHFSSREKREVVAHVKNRNYHQQDEFGGPDWHINTAGGVLDLRPLLEDDDGEAAAASVREARPEDLYRAGLSVEFDPDAECPRWREFLKRVTSSEADRMLLQEFAGYTLMHWDYPFHKALFLVGPGASGKSTFLNAINGIVGPDGVSSVTPHELIEERFAGVELHGAWANIRNEISEKIIKNTGKFKEIVAGDPIKVEEKNQPTFTIEPKAKHLYATNTLPEASVDDDAFYRRILLVTFPTSIPRDERDPRLDRKLEAEYPGILNWMIGGLRRLLQQGRFTGDEVPEQTRRTWEMWGSSVERFKQECMEKAVDAIAPKSFAYNAYLRYCDAEGLPAVTQRKMTRRLKQDPDIEDGRRTIGGKRRRCYVGARIIEEKIPAPDAEGATEGDESDPTGLDNY